MHRLVAWIVLFGAGLLVPSADALTMAYGEREIEASGAGCVGGWTAEHGNVAYFRGTTDTLNRQLAELARSESGHEPPKIVLHVGEKFVENPIEPPLSFTVENKTDQLRIDWSMRRVCLAADVLQGRCECDRRSITIDVWISGDVTLDTLSIPSGFTLEPARKIASSREIQEFIERRSHDE